MGAAAVRWKFGWVGEGEQLLCMHARFVVSNLIQMSQERERCGVERLWKILERFVNALVTNGISGPLVAYWQSHPA